MTNQPDAYTLAAQAAADRARAEALQKGGAQPGPGLQSPMRRLSRNPAARWVLSGVLLAAGTALAVDYVNGPLGPWIRYHWPVPGSGGKSGARIAAELSAKPQAQIDADTMLEKKKITGPVEAQAAVMQGEYEGEAREDAYITQNTALSDSRIKPSNVSLITTSPIRIQLLDEHMGIISTGLYLSASVQLPQGWKRPTPNDPPYYISIQDSVGFPAALETSPVELSGKATITPYNYTTGAGVAWTTGPDGQKRVLVAVKEDDGDPKYGFITAKDYSTLGGPPLGPTYTGRVKQ